MQGALAGTSYLWCCVGLIPACAGNTEFWTCALTAAWAHPRSRGEHMPLLLPKLVESGSSPLARGTRLMARYGNILLGLIPARAGDTPVPRRSYTMFRAHPRSRGEHSNCSVIKIAELGSSPLARGTPSPVPVEKMPTGLIPARAGNTERMNAQNESLRAHPRSRGEHLYHYCRRCRHWGSSPLARGTRRCLLHDQGGQGSSPLARGTRSSKAPATRYLGLIPARAGNTGVLPFPITLFRAHPRSRGEHGFGFST